MAREHSNTNTSIVVKVDNNTHKYTSIAHFERLASLFQLLEGRTTLKFSQRLK